MTYLSYFLIILFAAILYYALAVYFTSDFVKYAKRPFKIKIEKVLVVRKMVNKPAVAIEDLNLLGIIKISKGELSDVANKFLLKKAFKKLKKYFFVIVNGKKENEAVILSKYKE